MTNKRNENAVSEILGALLLLLIVILTFSVIYFYVISEDGPVPKKYVFIVGDINGQNVTLTHTGGESLDANDTISFTEAGKKESYLIKDYLIDENDNTKWDFGEKILYKIDLLNHLDLLDQYESIGVQAIDGGSNAIAFQGPVRTKYKSDVGVSIKVNNSHPIQGQPISITISAWCLGGDIPAAGGVIINFTLPQGIEFINYTAEQGSYNITSGMWNLGNLLVKDSPVNLTIKGIVNPVPFHEPTQLGLIFEGSEYTSGSVSVWQNTYLSGLRFALNAYTTFPHDGSVELTIVSCGGTNPPLAKVELSPTIITESNYFHIGQDLRSTPYIGGYAPISSAIRLITDQMVKSTNFSKEKRQLVLIVSSGNPDCIWDKTTANGYGGLVSSNKTQIKMDTINAAEYLYSRFDFDEIKDELDAMTVAKTIDLRNSSLFNESIVMAQPGNIYDKLHPIVEPGWVYEVESGKDNFQKAFDLIIKLLLNRMKILVSVDSTTTIDPNNLNDNYVIQIQPIFI